MRGCLRVLEYVVPYDTMAARLMALVSADLKKQLLDDWDDRAQIVFHKDQPHLKDDFLPELPLCYWARMCVCARPELTRFCRDIMTTMRRICPAHSKLREMLTRGFLVWRLVSPREGDDDFWFYVGYINLTTFRAAVLKFVRDDDPESLGLAEVVNGWALTPEDENITFQSWWQLFTLIDLSHPWALQVAELSARQMHCTFSVRSVLAEHRDEQPVDFWAGPKNKS